MTNCQMQPVATQTSSRHIFGWIEAVFNSLYLGIALVLGILLLSRASVLPQMLAGVMALVLVGGDAFHLVPRIMVVLTGDRHRWQNALGFGKLVASITMTLFYVLLWHIGIQLFIATNIGSWTLIVYLLAAIRIGLCLPKHNRWHDIAPPVSWGIYRNIPFALLGVLVAGFFAVHAQATLSWLWLAIALSFAFYLPVVVGVNKNRKLGMLMLPKSCAYLWILSLLMTI